MATTQIAAHRVRSWRSFSLRSLLVLVTLVAVWLAIVTHRARQQRLAIKKLQEASATLLFAHQFDSQGNVDVQTEPWAPKWLRDIVGEEYFRTLVYAELISDRKRLLRHGKSKVDDEVMSAFSRVNGITRLELDSNPKLTDEGLRHLRHLRHLRQMSIWHANVKGQGLRHLLHSRNLEHLQFDNTPLTDEGLKYLGQLPNLIFLRLNATKVTDDGLAHLSRLTKLETLVLNNTDISDRGLAHLSALQGLSELHLTHTRVTAEGVLSLERALPACTIWPPAERLRRKPRNLALWPGNHKPSRAELLDKIKELKGSFKIRQGIPGQPIVEFELRDSDISDESLLRLLDELPDIEALEFHSLLIGDKLAAGLRRLPKLSSLALDNCPISDEGLKHVGMLPELTILSLQRTPITDHGLQQLAQLKGLKKLSVHLSRTTIAGLTELQRALPNCDIR